MRQLHLREVRKNENNDNEAVVVVILKVVCTHVAKYFPQTGQVDIDTVMTEPIHNPFGRGGFQGAKNKRFQNNSLTT